VIKNKTNNTSKASGISTAFQSPSPALGLCCNMFLALGSKNTSSAPINMTPNNFRAKTTNPGKPGFVWQDRRVINCRR
jgi:hypothetical protein